MRIWMLKTCDTCRKAVRELAAAGWQVTPVDVRADGVQEADLERFLAEFGEALINRRSTTWRGLSEEEQALDPLRLLVAYPTLMKRPVVEAKGRLTLGWTKDVAASWAAGPA